MPTDLRWTRTHCGRMDHGGCALLVGVSNNRIVKIKGDPQGYLNQGFICPKGLAGADRLGHPQRLTHPLKRQGARGDGRWQTITWSQALETVAEHFQRVKARLGARSVAFCQGMPKGLEHFVLIRLANLFGSPNVVAQQDVCHAPREISGRCTCGFYPVVDFHYPSRRVVLWGSNIAATHEEGTIFSLLGRQMRRGTELMVIDPRQTPLARKARVWLPLKPGSDGALALAFLHVIISESLYDRSFVRDWTTGFKALAKHVGGYTPERLSPAIGLAPEHIRRGARFYAQYRPTALAWGNPIEQTVHNFDTARALVCLMAITGNLDIAGGNIQAHSPQILSPGRFVRAAALPDKAREMLNAHHGAHPRLMTVAPAFFKQAVLEQTPYPVKAAYFQGTNPLVTYAGSRRTLAALKALDFFAVTDIFMTPTAAMADIVLPAATHFEFDDIGHYGLGHGHILARPRVVTPPADCRSDLGILNRLGKLLVPAADWPGSAAGFLEEILAPSGMVFAEFARRGFLKGPERFESYRRQGFKTPSGKVELTLGKAQSGPLPALPLADGPPEAADPRFPLILTSAKSACYLHSSYRWVARLRRRQPHPEVALHPRTAARYGIGSGDPVTIETRNGRITQTAKVTDTVLPGVVHAAVGWWFPEADPGEQFDWVSANYNQLTDTQPLGVAFGTPNLKGIGCRIYKGGSTRTRKP